MAIPGIKVFAPATVGNVACGFDALGLAIAGWGDEVVARRSTTPGVRLIKIIGDGGRLPRDPAFNTASGAALSLLKSQGIEDWGIDMELHKKLPLNSGVGSSAASAVAGALAANALLTHPLDRRELLQYVMDGEALASGSRQADNAAPSLLGGAVLVRDNLTLDVHRLYVPEGLWVVLVCPKLEIGTREARGILRPEVPLADAIQQAANLAALVLAFMTSNYGLLGRALRDVLIEPQRAHLVPNFYEAQDAAMQAGALGCSLSGSGPAMFALTTQRSIAEKASQGMATAFTSKGIECSTLITTIDTQGAKTL